MKVFPKFIVISFTVFGVISLIIWLIMLFNFVVELEEQKQVEEIKLIRIDDLPRAAQRISNYHYNTHKILTECQNGGVKPLVSYRLDIEKIRSWALKWGLFGIKYKYDELILIPAMHDQYSEGSPDAMFNFIVAGVKDEKIDFENMYDYCEPCPNACNRLFDINNLNDFVGSHISGFSFKNTGYCLPND